MDKHIKRGVSWSEREEDIPRLIGVFILGVPMEELEEVVTRTAEFDIDKRTEFWDRMRKYYISLPNFQLVVEKSGLTPKDIWLETIKNLGNMENLDPEIYEIADEALLKLIEKAKVSALSEAEYAQYEAELKVLSNRGTVERYGYEQGIKRGLAEGRAQGLKEGLKEGREEGIKKGILETNLSIARMMKQKGYPTEEITAMTGLNIDEIEE